MRAVRIWALHGLKKFLKHIDFWALIVAAAHFTFAGLTSKRYEELIPIIVALLGLLAVSQFRNRADVVDEVKTWKRERTDLFSSKFPQRYLDAQSNVSHSYFYTGATMRRTITNMHEHLTRILEHRGSVQILLPNPSNERLLGIIAETHPTKDAQGIKADIENALRLAQELEPGKGAVKIRTIDFVPHIGINAMDVDLPDALIMVQMYEFKGKSERAPIFLLDRDDKEWFKHFKEQIDRLWDSGTDYPPTMSP